MRHIDTAQNVCVRACIYSPDSVRYIDTLLNALYGVYYGFRYFARITHPLAIQSADLPTLSGSPVRSGSATANYPMPMIPKTDCTVQRAINE